MNTENMPTTNQGPEDTTLVDKIPPTVAEGFKKAAGAVGNATMGAFKQAAGTGMSAS